MIRLLRNTKTGAVVDFNEGLLTNPDFEQMTEQEAYDYLKIARTPVEQPLDAKDGIAIRTSGRGIGDAVSALYVAAGYAAAGHPTRFYCYFHDLLAPLVRMKGLEIVPEQRLGADCNRDYQMHLAEARFKGTSRVEWYTRQIAAQYGIEPAQPARPPVKAQPDNNLVVLAPFAAHAVREWHVMNFVRLATLLNRKAGCRVLVVGGKSDEERCRLTFGMVGVPFRCGLPHDELAATVGGARMVVANESGIAHLAGLFGRDTLVPLGPTTPRWTYDIAPTVEGQVPAVTGCAGCFWQTEAGILPGCGDNCVMLQNVSVFQVFGRAIEILGAARPPERVQKGKRKGEGK